MSKAIIYDTEKKEYVTAVNRRLVSGTVDYLTSENKEKAQVVDADNLNLRDLEKTVGLERGRLEFQDAPGDVIRANERNKAITQILDQLDDYSNNFDRQDDADKLIRSVLQRWEWLYGFDTYDWQDELKEMLDDGFDE